MKRSATPLPWGSPTKAASSTTPSQLIDPWKCCERYWAAPVVAELDPPGDVRRKFPAAVDDGVVDGLEGSEAVADLGDVGPGLVAVVVEEGEDPHPAVALRPGHRGVGAPAHVRCRRDDRAVVDAGPAALGGALRREQA
jgi:hypothetical protein